MSLVEDRADQGKNQRGRDKMDRRPNEIVRSEIFQIRDVDFAKLPVGSQKKGHRQRRRKWQNVKHFQHLAHRQPEGPPQPWPDFASLLVKQLPRAHDFSSNLTSMPSSQHRSSTWSQASLSREV